MIWIIAFAIVGYILFRFFSSLSKDNDDLQGQTLSGKFSIIASMLNDAAFDGKGDITTLNKREFNLYEDGQNQIIKFQYSTGHLTIIWKYKYFQKEIIHERQFNDVRNLSIFDQQKIAEQMIKEMAIVIEKHQIDVIVGN
jgi:hypothetical protein